MGTHQRSFERYTIADPLRPPLPQNWGFVTPKLQSLLSQKPAGTVLETAHDR